jgi:hypothetical protein
MAAPRGYVVGDYVPALLFAALDTDTLSAEGLLLHRLGPAWAEHRGYVRSERQALLDNRSRFSTAATAMRDERHTTVSTATRCTGASTRGPMPPPPARG